MTKKGREQGQREAEAHIPVLKENYTEETSLSPSSPALAGTLPRRGEGPPSVQLLSSPPPFTVAAVPAPSISSKAGWKEGDEGRGASRVCLAKVTLASAAKRYLLLLREGAEDGVCPRSWVNGRVWVTQISDLYH